MNVQGWRQCTSFGCLLLHYRSRCQVGWSSQQQPPSLPILRGLSILFLSLWNDQLLSILTTIPPCATWYSDTLEPKSVPGNLDVCQSGDMLKKNVGPAVGGKAAQVTNGSGSWRLEAARDGRMWMWTNKTLVQEERSQPGKRFKSSSKFGDLRKKPFLPATK